MSRMLSTASPISISVSGEIFTSWIPNSLVLWKTCLNLKIPRLHMKDSDRYDSHEHPVWAWARVFLAIGWSLSWHQHLDGKSFQHDDFITKEPSGWGYTGENKTLASSVVFTSSCCGLWCSLQDDSPDCWKQDLLKIAGAVRMTAAVHTLKAEHRVIN